MKDLQRREFIKSAFLGANGLLLSTQRLDFFSRNTPPVHSLANVPSLSGLIYQNDFSVNLDGIKSYATLNLRRADGVLKFSTTNAGRGVYIGTPFPQGGKQYWLAIRLSNAGRAGLSVYSNRTDPSSLLQTITTTSEEVVIPFTSAGTHVDNRLFLATKGPEHDIAVQYIKIYDGVSYQTDLWAGTYQQIVNNRRYTWIPTKKATIIPQTNGTVVLSAPLTKPSFAYGNTCNRFIYDENYRRLGPTMLDSLSGPGANLPDGQYHYLIHYFNTDSYDKVDNDPWGFAANPDSYKGNSAPPEAISFSIETLNASFANQVTVPPSQDRVSWVITNQFLPENLSLPKGKLYGITRMHWDVVPDNKKANVDAVFKKVSQIQIAGREEFDSVHPDRLWDCITGNGQTPQQIAESITLSPGHSVMAQMKEQGQSNQDVETTYQLMYQKLKNNFGVTNPNQTNLYQDYFANTDGYGNGAVFQITDSPYEEKKKQLSSQSEARKLYGNGMVNGDRRVSEYFLANANSYRNWGAGGYLDSYQRNPKGIMIYRHIFEYEKSYMAINDRRTMCMSWSVSEGVNSQTTRAGVKYRTKLDSGDIIKTQPIGIPFELMKNQSFFSLLLGDSYALWHDSINLVKNINNWEVYSTDGNIEYQPQGAISSVAWDKYNPSHPKPTPSTILANTRETYFPGAPQIGEQGAWVGAYLYCQISTHSDRVSQSIRYASFSYRINGGETQSGYFAGNDPVNGSLGNAELSRQGFINEGQHNIVDQWEYQKPVVLVTRGAQGYAVIIKNVTCEPIDQITYTVHVGGVNRTINHNGRGLGIYLY